MAMVVSSIVDEVTDVWRSYVREQAQVTSLTAPLDGVSLTLTVADPTKIAVGLIQVDDELMQVRSIDRANSLILLEAWGRGQSSSLATTHATGAKLTSTPTTPRVRVRDILSDVMQEIFPQLFPVAEVTLNTTPAVVRYALPADAYHVLTVSHMPPGPSLTWIPVKRWRQNKTPTTVELEVHSYTTPGAGRVRVHYVRTPPPELAFTDDLAIMGYPQSTRGVMVLGAAARLAAFTETSRIQTGSVESAARSADVPAGASMGLSRYLYQLFRQRLDEEIANQQLRYPIVTHFTR